MASLVAIMPKARTVDRINQELESLRQMKATSEDLTRQTDEAIEKVLRELRIRERAESRTARRA